MTNQQLKRNEKAQNLRVIQVNDETFYVESSEGKICYRVNISDTSNGTWCTCGDYARNSKNDPEFKCKHILAVFNSIPTGQVVTSCFLEKRKPKLDERFVIQIDGKDFVKYAGLLDLGHQIGISKIEVETLQLPMKENGNFAICKATVVSKTGDTFIDIGDANPQNCNARISKHLLRLASTRSIARSLRAFTNIGMTCLEELDELDDVIGNGKVNRKTKNAAKKTVTPKAAPKNAKKDTSKEHPPTVNDPSTASDSNSNESGNVQRTDAPKMSDAQRRAIANLSRRRGISTDELENMSVEIYGTNLEHLTVGEASSFIRELQTAA